MTTTRRLALAGALSTTLFAAPGLAQDKIRIAFGDIPSVETLHFLIAIERAKEKGVQIEFTSVKSEDIAAQAVVGGQADIGVGTPYAMLQKVRAPVRMFYQLRQPALLPDRQHRVLQDLEGSRRPGDRSAFARLGHGSDHEARGRQERHQVQPHQLRAGLGGARRRAAPGQHQGVDPRFHQPQDRDGESARKIRRAAARGRLRDRRGAVRHDRVPGEEPKAVDTLVESLLQTMREINRNPEAAAELRKKYKLLPDLPKQLEADIVPYFKESVAAKSIPVEGGGPEAAKDDLAFFSLAGQLQGEASSLKVEDFWEFGPLTRAKAKLGTN